MNAESIADKIKRYRKINNMSQEELSTLSGINVSTIKKYECGYRNPKPDQLVKIANALNVSVLVFLSFDLTTTSDILALLIKLAENSDLEIECQKDNSDNYVTNTISLSFKDPVINQTLPCLTYTSTTDYFSSMLSKRPDGMIFSISSL